jgi:four helix bundle protein
MGSESFERLDVYRLAARLSDDIRFTTMEWETPDLWTLGIQLMRAADAVGADIAEAFGRGTRPDQLRFLFMARGSAYELQHWLSRAKARGLSHPADGREQAARMTRMLNGLIRSLGSNPDR